VLAGLAAASSAASLTASGATGCTFKGATWELDGRTGTTYAVTVLRGVTCSQAAAVVRPLTHRRSQGLRMRVPAPRGWLCLSLSPRGSLVARGDCARLGGRVAWQPAGGRAPGGGKPPTKPKPRGS
jgi:hypothetical protein